MRLHKFLISSFDADQVADVRTRAEVLTGALIIRQICVVTILSLHFVFQGSLDAPLAFVATISLICYFASRTKHYKISAWIIIIDPILFVAGNIAFKIQALMEAPQTMLALALGPLLASIVLSMRATLTVIALTFAVNIAILFRVNAASYGIFVDQMIMLLSVSIVAYLAAQMRDSADVALNNERAKFLQASRLSALGEMASGVAHELNSPLGAIVLNVELMEEFLNEPTFDKLDLLRRLKDVSNTASRMSEIIGGMKNITRDPSDDERVDQQVGVWIQETLNLCHQRLYAHGVVLKINSDNFEVICTVRSVQMTQALLNLMNNAFDAVQAVEEKWISIDVEISSEFAEIIVRDSGSGVSKKFVDKLFEPFATTKDYGQGTGLGLSVSRGLLKSHGGDLIYDPRSQNTTFVMKIPRLKLKAEYGENGRAA